MRYLAVFVLLFAVQHLSAQQQLDFELPLCPVINSVQESDDALKIHIFPNPSRGLFNLNIDLPSGELLRAECFDMLGQRIEEWSWNQSETKEIDLSNYGKGVYQLVIFWNNRRYSQKLLVL
ncbi:MAG: T9SS C-terminal target domain-containing protein [Cryomorphaceae bacterium]|nr:MAG: T9SS C-terminal target domain-containing protein [Cryomorphaceae bacterium]